MSRFNRIGKARIAQVKGLAVFAAVVAWLLLAQFATSDMRWPQP